MASNKTAVTLTREELYAMVWTKPLQTLGSGFGVSGNAVAKVCKKLNVPVPGRGYWAKVSHGKRTRRIGLPPRCLDVPDKATIDPCKSTRFPKPSQNSSEDSSDTPAEAIQIPGDLSGCHPLVSATRRVLETQGPGIYGVIHVNTAGALKVTISRQSMPRVLRIMEALIRACIARGWAVESSDKEAMMRVSIGEDPVHVAISERAERSEIEQPAEAKLKRWYSPNYRYNPSGQLRIEVLNAGWTGIRGKWADGKNQKLETILPEFVVSLRLVSDELKKRRLKDEETKRRRAKEARMQEEYDARIKKEEERCAALFSQIRGWRRATEIRTLMDDLNRRTALEPGVYDQKAVFRWSEWACKIASDFDPFTNGYFRGLKPQRSKSAG